MALAVVVALLCPAGQIVSSIHEASVRHVICAEHGEMTHVTSLAPVGTPSHGPAVQSGANGDDHEHCLQAGILKRHRSLPPLIEGVAPEAVVKAALGEPARYIAPGTRLLLSAPKTSPPSA